MSKRHGKSDSQWWPRYTGDYGRKTEHLSLTQHGAYALLLDWYYSNAKPLPLEWVQMHRICKAVAPQEQDAVQTVVTMFFQQTMDGWRNERADEELEKRKGISEIRRKAQAEKERQRLEKEGANGGAKEGANAHTSTATSTGSKMDDDSATVFKLGERIAEVVGWKDDPRWMGNYSRLAAWLAGGCDFEIDILPTIKKVMANKRGSKPRTLNYFEKAIADAYATRTTPMEKGTPNATNRKDARKDGKSERAKQAILEGLNIGPGASSSE